LYNRAAFGSFFALSSSFERVSEIREMSQSGLWGVAVPFVIVAAALWLALDHHRFVLMGAGLLTWLMLGFLGVATLLPDSDGSRWYVERVYFEQPAAADEPVVPADSPIAQKMQRAFAAPPPSWPF
jgi:hypothetical protein